MKNIIGIVVVMGWFGPARIAMAHAQHPSLTREIGQRTAITRTVDRQRQQPEKRAPIQTRSLRSARPSVLPSVFSVVNGGEKKHGWGRRVAQEDWNQHKKLLDIRYISERKHTRLVFVVSGTLRGVAEGEAEADAKRRLPFRVYVDLTPCVPLKYWLRNTFRVDSPYVRKLRVGRNTLQTTRIVLELSRKMDYRVTMLRSPMRVVIDTGTVLPPSPEAQMILPQQTPQPLLRGKRQHVWQPPASPGAWRPEQGKPWVLRMPGELHLPFAFQVRRIAIDAGHGGREEGALGRRTRIAEKTITLDVARRVQQFLQQRLRGVRSFLIRNRDQTLSIDQRAAAARQGRADLLISIHINSNTDPRVHGISTYVLHWSEQFDVARLLSSNALLARENQGVHPQQFRSGVHAILNSLELQTNLLLSKYLGVVIQRSLLDSVRQKYPNIRDLGVRRGLFYLLFSTGVPSVLVEASFLSNLREERLLRTSAYRQQLAVGIGEGILKFIQMSRDSLRTRKAYPRLPRKP